VHAHNVCERLVRGERLGGRKLRAGAHRCRCSADQTASSCLVIPPRSLVPRRALGWLPWMAHACNLLRCWTRPPLLLPPSPFPLGVSSVPLPSTFARWSTFRPVSPFAFFPPHWISSSQTRRNAIRITHREGFAWRRLSHKRFPQSSPIRPELLRFFRPPSSSIASSIVVQRFGWLPWMACCAIVLRCWTGLRLPFPPSSQCFDVSFRPGVLPGRVEANPRRSPPLVPCLRIGSLIIASSHLHNLVFHSSVVCGHPWVPLWHWVCNGSRCIQRKG
jgi:hypothetical protein